MVGTVAYPPSGYNERLFSGGLRKWLHEARFHWLAGKLSQRSAGAVIVEIGCFDCRALQYIGPRFKRYRGFDADWEGGLSSAARKVSDPRISLHRCTSSEAFDPGPCDVVISLETLEHIDPADLPGYFRKAADSLSPGGVLIVSVPNETGLLFAAKQLYKSLFLEGGREYTLPELIFQTLGMVDRVERREHKGFGWSRFVDELGSFFEVQSVEGLQVPWLPLFLNPSIGIVATKRR